MRKQAIDPKVILFIALFVGALVLFKFAPSDLSGRIVLDRQIEDVEEPSVQIPVTSDLTDAVDIVDQAPVSSDPSANAQVVSSADPASEISSDSSDGQTADPIVTSSSSYRLLFSPGGFSGPGFEPQSVRSGPEAPFSSQAVRLSMKLEESAGARLSAKVEVVDQGVTEGDAVHGRSSSITHGRKRVKINHDAGPVKKIDLEGVQLDGQDNATMAFDDVPEDVVPRIFGWPVAEIYAVDPTGLPFLNGSLTATATGSSRRLYKCPTWNFSSRSCPNGWMPLRILVPGENYTVVLNASDPAFAETSESVELALAPINETAFVVAFVDANQTDVSFRIMDTNGSVIVDTVDADTTADVASSVSIAMINRTHFTLAWVDGPLADLVFAVYDLSGSVVVAATTADTNVGANRDVSVAQLGGQFALCDANGQDSDADYRQFDNAGAATVVESAVDITITPSANLQNLVSCSKINSTAWSYMFFDDADNDASYAFVSNTGTVSLAAVDLDIDVGETGQVAQTGLSNNRSAMVYFDSTDQDITIAIISQANTQIFAPTDIDITAGTDSRVDIARVRNDSELVGESFVVVWQDGGSADIKAAVYNTTGGQVTAPFTVEASPDPVNNIVSVVSSDLATGNEICPGTFIVAYTNVSNQGVFRGFYFNGSSWDGYCPPPRVFDAEFNGTVFNLSQIVNFTVNVTDNARVDKVRGNLTLPDGTFKTFNFTLLAENVVYNVTFNDTVDIGQYNVSVIANDTFGKVNSTERFFFIVNDTIAPSIINVSPNNTLFNQSTQIRIAANVTDNRNVSFVFANITRPDAVTVSLRLFNQSSSIFNATFTGTSTPGAYIFRIIANDSVNRQNISSALNFTIVEVADLVPPGVTNASPNNTVFNQGDIIRLAINATDNNSINNATANITLPDGSIQVVVLVSSGVEADIFNGTFTNSSVAGMYNVSFRVNDTRGNTNGTERINFSVRDVTAPNVTALNISPSNISQGQDVNVTVNVSDGSGVNRVLAQVTRSDGVAFNITMSPLGGQAFNATVIVFSNDPPGLWNVTIIANDSFGNRNASVRSNFTVNDVVAPAVRFLNASPDNISQGGFTNITVNVTDNFQVGTVLAEVTKPDGSSSNVTMNLLVNNIFNRTVLTLLADAPGLWNITIIANDSSGNVNRTQRTNFTVNDVTPPDVAALNVSPSNITQNQATNITVNVADNILVNRVLAQITRSNGSAFNITMSLLTGNLFNASVTPSLTDPPGLWNVTIIANDTSGNVNASVRSNFTVNDVTPPAVTALNVTPSNITQGQSVNVTVNVTDNTAVDRVIAQVTRSNGSAFNITMSLLSGITYNATVFSSLGDSVGLWNVTILANDSSGNLNGTERSNFTVTGLASVIIRLNQTIYRQATPSPFAQSDFEFNQTIPFVARFTTLAGTPYTNGNCTVNSNTTGIQTELSFDAGSGNYSGNISSFTEYDNTSFFVSCSAPNVIPVSNSTSAIIVFTAFLIETRNISFGGPFSNTTTNTKWLSKVEPSSASAFERNFEVSISPNMTGVNFADFFFCAGNPDFNCSFIRTGSFRGTIGMRVNMSVSQNDSCKPSLCLEIHNAQFEEIYLQCAEKNVSTTPSVVEANISINATSVDNNQYLGMHIHCAADPNLVSTTSVNMTLFYNYTSMPATLEIRSAEPVNLIANLIRNEQSLRNYTLGPNQRLNVTINHTTSLNNTNLLNLTFHYGANQPLKPQFKPRFIVNTTYVFNSTGQVWASDNASLGAPKVALLGPGVISYDTEVLPSRIPKNNTIRVDRFDALFSNETLVLNASGLIIWNASISSVFIDGLLIDNVTVFTNFSIFNVSPASEFNFSVNVTNLSGTFDISNSIVTDVDAKTITMPVVRVGDQSFIVSAKDIVSPRVVNLSANPPLANQGQDVRIAANVTDGVKVDVVIINVSFPNGSFQILMLANASSDIFNASFTSTLFHPPGLYNVTIIANDTSNNVNRTQRTNFTIVDVTAPLVTALNISPSNITQNQSINITVNVSDNIQVDRVLAQITRINGSSFNLTMSLLAGLTYNATLKTTAGDSPGLWNVTIIANDSSGNVNNSVRSNVTVVDITNPDVTAPNVSNISIVQGLFTNITVNVSDNFQVDKVIAQITRANGSAFNLTMSLLSGLTYNATVNTTEGDVPGLWNVTIIANDTSGNINASVRANFTVNDITRPKVTALNITPSNITQNQTTNITVNVTDNFQVDKVLAQITRGNGSAFNVTMSLLSGFTFNFTLQTSHNDAPGLWNVSIIANDSSNNVNASVRSSLTVNDVTSPEVRSLSADPSNFFQDESTNIEVNVSDNYRVDVVFAQITRSNGSAFNITMSLSNGVRFNATVFVSGDEPAGLWNVSIIANDTSGNVNASVRANLTVNDSTAPRVTALNVSPSNITQGEAVNITVNVTDEPSRDAVVAQITRSNGSAFNVTMSLLGGSTFNASVLTTASDPPGEWNVTIIANDTTNNVNASIRSNFTVNDVTPPSVTALNISPSNITVPDTVNITVNVSDNFRVDKVIAQVTRSNGSAFNVTMSLLGGAAFNATVRIITGDPAGLWNVTILANDTSNNGNASARSNFTVNAAADNLAPNVTALNISPSNITQGQSVNVTVNVTDDFNVSVVLAQVTRSNGSAFNVTMSLLAGFMYNATVSVGVGDPPGLWNVTIIANDTSANVNASVRLNFTVNDITSPEVTALNISPSAITQGQAVNVTVNVSENFQVETVLAQITRSNGSAFNVTMSSLGGFMFNASVLTGLLEPTGLWNVTIIANDTSNNVNASVRSNFTVNAAADNLAPNVTALNVSPSIINQGQFVNVTVNVTDDFNVSVVRVQVTRSNGSAFNLTASLLVGATYNATVSVSVDEPAGLYNITIIANDTSGNVNSSTRSNFTVNDVTSPKVTALNVSPSNVTQGQAVNITVNVSDETARDGVLAQVTRSNGSSFNITMSLLTGLTFNASVSTSLSDPPGLWNVTIIANDSSNNVNASTRSNFTVNDVTAPEVTALNITPSNFTQNQSTNITVNVSDNIGVSFVFATIVRANGSSFNLSMSLLSGITYNATVLTVFNDAPGLWNVTIIANDTSGNANASVRSNFTVNDITRPEVTALNISPSNFTQNQSTNITVNVSDNYQVDRVLAQVTRGNGSAFNITMSILSGIMYNATVLSTFNDAPGLWNVTILANDTSNNVNASVRTNFTVNDITNPDVTAPNVSNISIVQGLFTNITVNVSDNFQVDKVIAQITRANGSAFNLTMSLLSGLTYNATINTTEGDVPGLWNVTIIANDTSGNINASVRANFTVNDITRPRVSALNITPSNLTQNQTTNLTVNVSDNFQVDKVLAQVTRGNGSAFNITLSLLSVQTYNGTLITSFGDSPGLWNITILANDTSNNGNASVRSNITVNDVTAPEVTAQNVSPSNITAGNSTNITVNVSDNFQVGTVLAQVTRSDGSAFNLTMSLLAGLTYNATVLTSFNDPSGLWNVTFLANDTSNNVNASVRANLTVNPVADNLAPNVTALNVSPSIINQSQFINVTVNVTDNFNVSVVLAQVTRSNGSSFNFTMSALSGATFNATITISSLEPAGLYNLTIIANDTSNNVNASVRSNFTVNDVTSPSVTALNVSPSNITQGQLVNVTVNVTDETARDAVRLQVTRANGSAFNLTMTLLAGSSFNATILTTSSDPPGLWNVTIIANDTAGNVNSSVSSNFTVNDVTAPSVTALNITPSNITQNQSVNITVNVTDNYQVDRVLAQVTRGNASAFNVTMTLLSGITYNSTLQTSQNDAPGLWNVTILANDTSNNVNGSIRSNFTVNDVTNPDVTAPNVSNISIVQGLFTNITVNVSDNFQVDKVIAQITRANGSAFNLTMSLLSGLTYNATINTSDGDVPGLWNVTIIANDTSGNINASVRANFTVNDITRPRVTALNITPSNITQNQTTNITVNVTDNFQLDEVLAQVTRGNGSAFNLTMSLLTGSTYNATLLTFFGDSPGRWNITVIANDTSNNINASVGSNITVNDITTPSVSNISPNFTDFSQDVPVNISANVTDNAFIDTVFANVSMPNGAYQIVTFARNSPGSDIFNGTFQNLSIAGRYNFTVIANDSGGNRNDTVSGAFFRRLAEVNLSPSRIAQGEEFFVSTARFNQSNVTMQGRLNATVSLFRVQERQETDENGSLQISFNSSFTAPPGNFSFNVTQIDEQDRTGVANLEVLQRVADLRADNPNYSSNSIFTLNGSFYVPSSKVMIEMIAPSGLIVDGFAKEVNSTEKGNISFTFNVTNLCTGQYALRAIDQERPYLQASRFINISATAIGCVNTSNFLVNESIQKSSGEALQFNITFINSSNGAVVRSAETSTARAGLPSGMYDVVYKFSGFPVLNITMRGLNVSNNLSAILLADEPFQDSFPIGGRLAEKGFSIDIRVNFTNATLMAVARSPFLYKCSNFSFSSQTCLDGNFSNIRNLTPGEAYEINLTPGDPVFFEASENTKNPDNANFTGIFDNPTGTFGDLVSDDAAWFSVEHNVTTVNLLGNMSVFYNFSNIMSVNGTPVRINGTINYCHARRISSSCTAGNQPALGAPGAMSIFIFNSSSNAFQRLGPLNATTLNRETNITWSINGTNLSQLMNGSFIVMEFEYSFTGGLSAFLADFAPLTVNFTFQDVTTPRVFDAELNGSTQNVSRPVNFTVNVTDNSAQIDRVFANVTLPDGSVRVFNFSQLIGDIYNATINETLRLGRYNVSVFANDSSGNLNNTERFFFLENDTVNPRVTNMSPNSTVFEQNAQVVIAVNVTDNGFIDNVSANVTLPGGSIVLVALPRFAIGSDIFRGTFSSTSNTGEYFIRFIANDSAGNSNGSQITNFSVTAAEGFFAPLTLACAQSVTVDDQVICSVHAQSTVDGSFLAGTIIRFNVSNQTGSTVVTGTASDIGAGDYRLNFSVEAPGAYIVAVARNGTSFGQSASVQVRSGFGAPRIAASGTLYFPESKIVVDALFFSSSGVPQSGAGCNVTVVSENLTVLIANATMSEVSFGGIPHYVFNATNVSAINESSGFTEGKFIGHIRCAKSGAGGGVSFENIDFEVRRFATGVNLTAVLDSINESRSVLRSLLERQFEFSQEEIFLVTDAFNEMTQISQSLQQGVISPEEAQSRYVFINQSLAQGIGDRMRGVRSAPLERAPGLPGPSSSSIIASPLRTSKKDSNQFFNRVTLVLYLILGCLLAFSKVLQWKKSKEHEDHESHASHHNHHRRK